MELMGKMANLENPEKVVQVLMDIRDYGIVKKYCPLKKQKNLTKKKNRNKIVVKLRKILVKDFLIALPPEL